MTIDNSLRGGICSSMRLPSAAISHWLAAVTWNGDSRVLLGFLVCGGGFGPRAPRVINDRLCGGATRRSRDTSSRSAGNATTGGSSRHLAVHPTAARCSRSPTRHGLLDCALAILTIHHTLHGLTLTLDSLLLGELFTLALLSFLLGPLALIFFLLSEPIKLS